MAYRSNRFARKARPYAAAYNMVKTGLKYGAKAYKSYTKYNRKKSGATNTVTAQYDTTQQYRKKRMPKWKKRGWIKFSRKVNAVIAKSHGTKTAVFNGTCFRQVGAGNPDQGVLGCFLYGKSGIWNQGGGIAEVGLRDLYEMVKDRPDDNRKFMFTSAVLDLTAKNVGTANLEVDLYFVSFGEDLSEKGECFQEAVRAAEDETTTINTQYTGLRLADRGVTLFDLPVLIKALKMKIWSKRKYFLPAGQTFTYQYRDPKNHFIPQSRIKEFVSNEAIDVGEGQFIYPYLTKGVICVYKKITSEQGLVGDLNIGVTRKYTYKDIASTLDEDGYNTTIY